MDNAEKIINYLGKEFDKMETMHSLARILQIPYASFYRTIEQIKDLLIITRIGKSKVLKLNLENPILTSYLAISSDNERREFLKKSKILKIIQEELDTKDIVLLFGSYAKGKETENSDIDMMVINKKGEKTVSFSKHELLFRKQINPIYFKIKEFKEMLKSTEENVGTQALRNHIVLNNPQNFWEVVVNAIR